MTHATIDGINVYAYKRHWADVRTTNYTPYTGTGAPRCQFPVPDGMGRTYQCEKAGRFLEVMHARWGTPTDPSDDTKFYFCGTHSMERILARDAAKRTKQSEEYAREQRIRDRASHKQDVVRAFIETAFDARNELPESMRFALAELERAGVTWSNARDLIIK